MRVDVEDGKRTLLCFNCLIGMREDQVSCACGCGGLKENTIIIYFQLNWNERGSSPLCLWMLRIKREFIMFSTA